MNILPGESQVMYNRAPPCGHGWGGHEYGRGSPLQVDVVTTTKTTDLHEASRSLATHAMSLKHLPLLPTLSSLKVIELLIQPLCGDQTLVLHQGQGAELE